MDKYPVTAAIRYLRDRGIEFDPHLYNYVEQGGTSHSAQMLGVDEHKVIKTLVMESHDRRPFIVLMHGDCEVSTKKLARDLSLKSVTPCNPQVAQKHTGYLVGGTSPFGTRADMPVYVESTIFALDRIYINGGKRGFLVSIDPKQLRSIVPVSEVSVAIPVSNK
jgi:Cys-tRNA(Pro) deacylase